MGSVIPLPFWQINVPPSQRTTACPPFLANLSAKDLGIISTPDADYRNLSWPEVRAIIAKNHLEAFQRKPSELRRYLEYNFGLKQKYGSIMEFVLTQRLGWKEPILASGNPFEKEEDIKILYNDWPYGLDPKIVHLVIWTKFELEEDPVTNDLKDETRAAINSFVDERFCKFVGEEKVIWFKNFKHLKSVHAVEHFHVMLYDPDPLFIEEITNGDIPLSQKV